METQTRYDLNTAIESWRSELAAQPNLTAEVRRELETHLRDAIASFQQRGLNDEECFWLACKRVGQPPHLGEEFVKANPAALWRERVFWVAAILLAIRLWSGISMGIWAIFRTITTTPYILNNYRLHALLFSPSLQMVIPLLSLVLMIGIALLLFRGRLIQSFSRMQFFFRSRRWFLLISATLFLFYFLPILYFQLGNPHQPNSSELNHLIITMDILTLLYPAIHIGLVVWLMPTQNQKTPKRV